MLTEREPTPAEPLLEAPTPRAAIAGARARSAEVLLSRHILAQTEDFTVVGVEGLEFPRAYVLVTPAYGEPTGEVRDLIERIDHTVRISAAVTAGRHPGGRPASGALAPVMLLVVATRDQNARSNPRHRRSGRPEGPRCRAHRRVHTPETLAQPASAGARWTPLSACEQSADREATAGVRGAAERPMGRIGLEPVTSCLSSRPRPFRSVLGMCDSLL